MSNETNNDSTPDNGTEQAPVSIMVPAMMAVPVNINRATVATIEIDLTAMPAAARAFLFDYGLRQNLNDAKAGESDPGNAEALMRKRLARLMAGEFGQRSGGGGSASADPVDRRAIALARPVIRDYLKNVAGIKTKQANHPDYDRLVEEYAATPDIRAEAERQIAGENARRDAMKAAAGTGGGLTLAGLGLAKAPAPDSTPAPDLAGTDSTPE